MSERDVHAESMSWLTSGSVRRRFALAAWGSAAGFLLIAIGVGWMGFELYDMKIDTLVSDEGIGAMVPNAGIVGWLAWRAVREVRLEQRELTESAAALVTAAQGAVRGDPQSEFYSSALRFGSQLATVSTAFNTRVFPRRASASFSRQVCREAKGEGLSDTTLRAVQQVARTAA
ncbi:hypothetical protein ACFXKF_32955 [Streptomyces scopuliridis]|uniref:hypothetical protein n=1 Tax=Streptomyces scopuliridis TaxID=452529 RepID=UPI0036B15A66